MRSLGTLLGTVFTGALMTLSTTAAWAQVCPSLTLTTQAQVDSISCNSVTGSVTIDGADIANVDGLGGITSVGGELAVFNNAVLTNVDGMGGITSVGGDLRITDNAVLTNVDGMGGVTSVGGSLRIADNAALTNVDGVGGITLVEVNLSITDNAALDSFCGLFPLLDAGALVGGYLVQNNATNPIAADILTGGPCFVPVPGLGTGGSIMTALAMLAALSVLTRRMHRAPGHVPTSVALLGE